MRTRATDRRADRARRGYYAGEIHTLLAVTIVISAPHRLLRNLENKRKLISLRSTRKYSSVSKNRREKTMQSC